MATNFLQATGASTTGFFSAVTTLISSELTSLGTSTGTGGSTAVSASVYTSSASFGQALWGEAVFYTGSAISPLAGGFLSGWWLKSIDGGTTFESTVGSSNVGLARPPDFVIPFSTVAYGSSNQMFATGIVKMPWPAAKLYVQNSAGVALASSSNAYSTIKIGPVAVQY